MKFRLGLVVGLAVGFVLGARAGRERYDQLAALARRVAGDERVQQAGRVAGRGTEKARSLAGKGLVAASEQIRKAAST